MKKQYDCKLKERRKYLFPEINSSSKIIGKISKKKWIENIQRISGINPSY